ncbi:MAG: alkaline phosphatase [Planctomycetota bacterium]
MNTTRRLNLLALFLLAAFDASGSHAQSVRGGATISSMQKKAASSRKADWAHWGPEQGQYSSWITHSNRLVPTYVFGGNLGKVAGENSVYRSKEALKSLYGKLPEKTYNPNANYFDQTDVYRLQMEAIKSGKKKIILMVFDGMDWQTARAAALFKTKKVEYDRGRGTGLSFQDYDRVETDFGSFVSSPHNNGTNIDVNTQQVKNPGGATTGGYNAGLGGDVPWISEARIDPLYLIAKHDDLKHAYTDSAASATSMTSGYKTYNNAINVDFSGREILPLGRTLQEKGFAVGAVTSVPISHATPACAYASNVHRSDYQDITRDLIGVPSVYHPGGLKGLDVLIGCGWGEAKKEDGAQGKNFVPGNRYLAKADLEAIQRGKDGFVTAIRTPGKSGKKRLLAAAATAAQEKKRLLGFYGVQGGHLPFQTADGDYDTVPSFANPNPLAAEEYTPADLNENPELHHMTQAALDVLDARSERWWLMVEAGDVDWANHANNIDNSIGAVLSGDRAFDCITNWVGKHGGWQDFYLIVTADHGHYLVIDQPQAIANAR